MKYFHSIQHEDILGLEFGHHPYQKPNLKVYLYYIDGLLIDTGQNNCQKLILEKTKKLDVNQIFLTHHHEDHTGNIDALQKQHQCEVYTSELCYELMKQPPKISLAQKMVWGDRPANYNLTLIKDFIETPNYRFELIPIPGHAQDMFALYEPTKKWLFSSDLYINSYISYMLKDESISQQIESIQKVLELDFDILFCSHNPKLKNGKQQLKKKLEFLKDFSYQVIQHYQKGLTNKQIFKVLRLKENKFVKFLSNGQLSKMNMVNSVIGDYKYFTKS